MKRFLNLILQMVGGYKLKTQADKTQFSLILIMQIGFLTALVLSIYEQVWLSVFVCVAALVAVWFPSILAKSFHVHFPIGFEMILNLFVYGTLILGEIHGFYTRFWWWDLVLHTGAGLALGFVGFLILFSLYRSGRLKASPLLIAVFSFCFALALGALWEILEFAADNIFGLTMQKSGLRDTMWDLIVDAGGAFITAFSGYVYMRYDLKGVGLFHYLVKRNLIK